MKNREKPQHEEEVLRRQYMESVAAVAWLIGHADPRKGPTLGCDGLLTLPVPMRFLCLEALYGILAQMAENKPLTEEKREKAIRIGMTEYGLPREKAAALVGNNSKSKPLSGRSREVLGLLRKARPFFPREEMATDIWRKAVWHLANESLNMFCKLELLPEEEIDRLVEKYNTKKREETADALRAVGLEPGAVTKKEKKWVVLYRLKGTEKWETATPSQTLYMTEEEARRVAEQSNKVDKEGFEWRAIEHVDL